MPLDPETQVVLEALAAAGADALGRGTPEEARAYERQSTYRAPVDPSLLAPVGSVEDSSIAGPDGPLPIRIYRPESSTPTPTVVYLHGGGFVLGGIQTHDPHCRLICHDVDAVIVSVEYRLAPEYPFPAAFDDAMTALAWADANVGSLGGDPARLAVAGDSAGGNLAAAASIHAARTGPRLAAQMLIYPKTDFGTTTYQSETDNAEGYFLTLEMANWFQRHYLPDGPTTDPRASVVHAGDFAGVAPAVIGVGEYDLLRDEVEAYADALSGAGVPVSYHRFDGLVHGFYGMRLQSAACASAAATLNRDFRALLHDT